MKILTEERGEVRLGVEPEYTVIIDPIDGSTNFKFGLELSGFSIAFIKGDVGSDELNFDDIKFAFIGNVFTGAYWYAKKGEGGVRVRRYLGQKIEEKLKTIDGFEMVKYPIIVDTDVHLTLDHDQADKERFYDDLITIFDKSRWIRRFGACSLELVSIAHGGALHHIDVRKELTPENFAAAYLIVKEAGGVVTDEKGDPFKKVKFRDRYCVIGSANKTAHDRLLKVLQKV